MNKPATKEPSMDEILSSIRQIIADDDAAVAPPPPRPASAVAPVPASEPVKPVLPQASAPAKPAPAPSAPPLALSPAQMLDPAPHPAGLEPRNDFSALLADFPADKDDPDAAAAVFSGEPALVDPEDVAFEGEPGGEAEPPPELVPAPPRVPPAQSFAAPPRPAMPVSQAAPLPDPKLSEDMAEQLLAPATNAAVQSSISRLNAMTQGGVGGQTVEGMMRELLRPMLKDWLDENLPALVERMVEKEIARISRGVK